MFLKKNCNILKVTIGIGTTSFVRINNKLASNILIIDDYIKTIKVMINN